MDNIHVILCGTTDAAQVEGVLQGTFVKRHYAWNRKYRYSCTSALSIDRVDSRLRLVSHLIVLCKGCRPPKDKSAYNGRPVLSVPGATPACVEEVKELEFYYGSKPLAELRDAVALLGLSPPHVVFDSLLRCFTPLGEAAYRRAFWLLDKDNDGVLSTEELLAWARLTRSAAFSEQDLTAFLASVSEWIGPCADSTITQTQFNLLHQHWLETDQVEEAWATLHAVGTHPDGLPYSWYDLNSVRIDRDVNAYLSPHAIQFFRNVYRLKGFADPSSGGMWRCTPGCPWAHIDGFSSASNVPLDRFIEYWKYMALERRDVVVMYARYWGYKGDAGFLFVQRSTRASRGRDETLPNTLQVLVVGAESSGRRSLICELTRNGKEALPPRTGAPLFARATTFYVEKVGGSGGAQEEAQTIVYTSIHPSTAEVVLTNEALNKTFDIVLLCVDGSDYDASAGYVMGLFDRVKAAANCPRMPFLLVVTKSDTLDGDAAPKSTSPTASSTTGTNRAHGVSSVVPLPSLSSRTGKSTTDTLAAFAKANRLLWPPVMTSALCPEESETASLNEYAHAVALNPALAVGKAPLTWVRLLRRGTFTAIVVVGTVGLLQKLGQWALSRRKR